MALRNARATEINMATMRRQAMFQQLLTDPATAKEVRPTASGTCCASGCAGRYARRPGGNSRWPAGAHSRRPRPTCSPRR